MHDRIDLLVERLAAAEEELRDLAYDRLASAASDPDGVDAAAARRDEKRLNQARRGVERAVTALRQMLEPPET